MTFEETITAVIDRAVSEAVRRELRAHAETQAGSAGAGYLSVEEAARIAGVHPATIREWVKTGLLPRHQAGRHLRILRTDLDRFMASGKSDGEETRVDDIADAILARRKKA